MIRDADMAWGTQRGGSILLPEDSFDSIALGMKAGLVFQGQGLQRAGMHHAWAGKCAARSWLRAGSDYPA